MMCFECIASPEKESLSKYFWILNQKKEKKKKKKKEVIYKHLHENMKYECEHGTRCTQHILFIYRQNGTFIGCGAMIRNGLGLDLWLKHLLISRDLTSIGTAKLKLAAWERNFKRVLGAFGWILFCKSVLYTNHQYRDFDSSYGTLRWF